MGLLLLRLEPCVAYNKIPYQSLQKILKHNQLEVPVKMGTNAVFINYQENQITSHTITLSNMFYSLTRWQLRHLTFECAEKIHIHHPFNKQQRLAGTAGYKDF